MSWLFYLNIGAITWVKVIDIGETVIRTGADYISIGVDGYIIDFIVICLDAFDELELDVLGI